MEKELTSKESLSLITEMISRAKREAAGDGSFQLLLWGWVIALCNFGHYVLAWQGYMYPYIVWVLVLPAAIISGVKGYQERKNAKVKTHLDDFISQLWLAVFVGMITVIAFMPVLEFNHNPVILILAAIGVFSTGAIFKVNFIKLGGVVLFVGAIIGFLVPVSEQYLVGGVAMILGYLVPGYLLKNKFKSRV
ncbi:hypothetical protein DFQ04_1556 [Algoriphagus boseongensis]|uniref:Uncharacterized protein n=1 Tax=Algoriphagus boseongensis TaxID=1442587 RepID=A0A4R6T7L5_9BACT|nr:hypothetical protein [Algoriphagus boseongensis]TDQ16908.1 hypothetical protein DFQ04_1556 [Algoriphagus boseongensis]